MANETSLRLISQEMTPTHLADISADLAKAFEDVAG